MGPPTLNRDKNSPAEFAAAAVAKFQVTSGRAEPRILPRCRPADEELEGILERELELPRVEHGPRRAEDRTRLRRPGEQPIRIAA